MFGKVNWMELEKSGFIAKVQCAEVSHTTGEAPHYYYKGHLGTLGLFIAWRALISKVILNLTYCIIAVQLG